ncbi:Ger(x)C family germination protein [Alicyclobacillus cycloheptanicus]|uniref:Ger(X)C family germination protein n=1 Tax=Alicyclobacillus cycloheptanicus TaxID=1457 RepID=A0ABT9XM92_9BACL|nr:Ger(x)C family germination protein [Alicyclobacillus cycloheptanicus]
MQKRTVILMIGIDPAENTKYGVRVSLQLARPQSFRSAGTDSPDTEGKRAVVVSQEGEDAADAIRKIQLSTDRRLFFGHTRAIVIHQQLAKRGVMDMINPLLQSRTTSRETWLFVSQTPARDVLEYTPALDAIPSTYLSNFFENRLLLKHSYEATLGGFHQRLTTPGIQPVAVWIGAADKNLSAPRIHGFAMFRGDRFAGALDQEQSLGWMFVTNQFPKSILAFDCPHHQGGRFTVDVTSVKSRMRVRYEPGRPPQANITVRLRGWIQGGICVQHADRAELSELTRQVKTQVEELVNTSLKQCEAADTDIFGMGRDVYRFSNEDWLGDDAWNHAFARMNTNVKVDVRLQFLQSYTRIQLG